MPTEFYSRQWFRYVGAIVWTLLATFSLIFGPLFLSGVLKDANGQPARDAGIAMTIMSVPLAGAAALLWFNVIARYRPQLRICREAIEVNVIGASSLDGVPLIPSLVRIVWLVLSLQGFKSQIGWIPWSMLRSVELTGMPMAREIVIDGTIVYPTFSGDTLTARIGNIIAFCDAEFKMSLDEIATAIQHFHSDAAARESLPSLRL
jgi:hypothetical protein